MFPGRSCALLERLSFSMYKVPTIHVLLHLLLLSGSSVFLAVSFPKEAQWLNGVCVPPPVVFHCSLFPLQCVQMDATACFQVCFSHGIRGLWRPSCWPNSEFVDVPGVLILVVNWEQLLFLYDWKDAEKLWNTSRIWAMLIDKHQSDVITIRFSAHVTVCASDVFSQFDFLDDSELSLSGANNVIC